MRKILIGSVTALILVLALAGSAQAKCGAGCLNGKIAKLSKRLAKAEKTIASQGQTIAQQGQTIAGQGQTIASQGQAINSQAQASKGVNAFFSNCLTKAPVSVYGDPGEAFGYLFDTETETIKTTALDVTDEGDFIEAWILLDGCAPLEVLSSAAMSQSLSPAGGLFQPQLRVR